jgi:dihydrodipicolinate reductase
VDRAAVALITLELRVQGIRQVRHLHKDLQEALALHKPEMAVAVVVVVQVLQEAQRLLQPVGLVGMEYHHPLLELQ